MVYVCVVLAGQ